MQTVSPVIDRPELTFPPEVTDWVRSHYEDAQVILEYGSGGSTVMAAEMSGKTVFSVESDPVWRDKMLAYLDTVGMASKVTLHHADIGPVGKWGKPLSHEAWELFHRYPNSVWDLPAFQNPDLILVDGRFRCACVMTAILRTTQPVTVLFDDYADRGGYHVIERFAKPVEHRGRMARFEIEPTEFPRAKLTEILRLYTKPF